MYNCKKCGHALSSNSALCPNCAAMMDNRQPEIRKSLKNNNNAYMDRLDAIRSRNIMNKNEEKSNTNIIGYALFIVAIVLLIAFIIGVALIRR